MLRLKLDWVAVVPFAVFAALSSGAMLAERVIASRCRNRVVDPLRFLALSALFYFQCSTGRPDNLFCTAYVARINFRHRAYFFIITRSFSFTEWLCHIVSKSSRPVTITSSPIGAKVTISKSSGVPIQVGETPLTVTLETSNGFFTKAKYTVEATKPGYQASSTVISADLNGWYLGNIVFGGLIGLLIVDPATGAMWKLDDTYSVNLAPTKRVALSNGESVHVVSISDIPAHLRSKLVKVGRLASSSMRN